MSAPTYYVMHCIDFDSECLLANRPTFEGAVSALLEEHARQPQADLSVWRSDGVMLVPDVRAAKALAGQVLGRHKQLHTRARPVGSCPVTTHPGTSPTPFRCMLRYGHDGEHDYGAAYRSHKTSVSTFDITEGQLVRYFHDRPEDAADVADRAACLKLFGFEDYHTGGNCMALRLERANGDYLLVTDDASIPTNEDPEVTVGAFNDRAGGNTEDFGGEECECFPSASNEVLYERIITWLGAESRRMRGAA